jgi:GntR family transcriptional regulator
MDTLDIRLAARPLYLQMRDVLVHKILEGQWKPGNALPNETLIAQQFGISIGTVRKALDLMEHERIVTRRQGRGTFVNDHTTANAGFPFSAIHNSDGQRITGQKRGKSSSRTLASAEEAARLGVGKGTELIRVERVREHQGKIFMTEVCLLPAKFFPLLPEDLQGYRLSALAQRNSVILARASECVDIVLANEDNARDLEIVEGTPVLRLDRVILSDRGDPLEWRVGHCYLRNERYLVRFD